MEGHSKMDRLVARGGRTASGIRTKIMSSMVVLGLIGVVAGYSTFSSFTSTTSNTGNTFSAGTVILADNDSNGSIFSMSGLKPGDNDLGCLEVAYTGTLASTVRLSGTTTGTGLGAFLTLKVTRGTIASPTFDSCAGFTADATDYIGGGNGVIFNGNMSTFSSTYNNYTNGLVDPKPATPESWTTNEKHVYKFEVTVQDTDSAQGLNATQAFNFEARNS